MAFITNVAELQALLDTCTSTEMILIPEVWIPMSQTRLPIELTDQ